MAKLKTIDITGLKDISAIMDKCHNTFKVRAEKSAWLISSSEQRKLCLLL